MTDTTVGSAATLDVVEGAEVVIAHGIGLRFTGQRLAESGDDRPDAITDEHFRGGERIAELLARHELPHCATRKRAPHELLREPLVPGRGEKRLSGYGHALNMNG